MSDAVAVALIAAVPALVGALASWRTHREVKTNHGQRAGQYLEQVHGLMVAHLELDDTRFQQLNAKVDDLASHL